LAHKVSVYFILYLKKTTCQNRASTEDVFSPQQEVVKLSLLQVPKIKAVNIYAMHN